MNNEKDTETPKKMSSVYSSGCILAYDPAGLSK